MEVRVRLGGISYALHLLGFMVACAWAPGERERGRRVEGF